MSTLNGGPRPFINTNGLVLNLDAGNTASYPGSGTTWTDLSGNGNNGTLTNGPTFNSANGGSFIFDGTDDYVITSYTTAIGTSGFTYATWIKFSEAQGSTIISKRMGVSQGFRQLSLSIGDVAGEANPGGKFSYADYNSGGRLQITTNTFNDGNWHYVVLTRSSAKNYIYVDGTSQSLTGDNSFFPNLIDTNNLFIGVAGEGNSPLAGSYYKGNISIVNIYNRSLSDKEVFQNYYAQKSRFGL